MVYVVGEEKYSVRIYYEVIVYFNILKQLRYMKAKTCCLFKFVKMKRCISLFCNSYLHTIKQYDIKEFSLNSKLCFGRKHIIVNK